MLITTALIQPPRVIPPLPPKPKLPHEVLTDVIDVTLLAGQLMLQHGAESARIEETVHHIGTGLGCDWLDILVSPNVLIITCMSGGEFRTKVRRVTRIGVNFAIVDAVNHVSYQVENGRLDRVTAREELERITRMPHNYSRWQVVGMVGLACMAFSQLFGADWLVSLMTLLAASFAMFIRQELTHRYFNPFVVVALTAFAAGIIASLASIGGIGERPELALAASVLLLVPGVPLITAAEDLLQGHLLTGMARGVNGALVSLAIATGLLVAMRLMGVEVL